MQLVSAFGLIGILFLSIATHVNALNLTVEGSHSAYNESVIQTQILTLIPKAVNKLNVFDIPPWIKFVVFEAHNQRHNITLAYANPSSNNLAYDQMTSGHDVGLAVELLPSSQNASVWLMNPSAEEELLVMVVIAFHTGTEPLPGGCNMEFNIEISPFLRLRSDGIENILEYQHARLGAPRGIVAPPCDTSFFFINYEVYAYYLKENDYSEEELFRGITLMNDVETIRKNGMLVKPLKVASAQRTRSIFLAYPGRGVIYNVIATYDKHVSAYVPIATYNCDFGSGIGGCGKLNTIPGILIISVLAAVAFMITLRGHQWFNLQMLFFGFIGAAVPTFILVAKYTTFAPQERDILTLVAGVIGGIIWLLIWKIVAFPILSLLVGGLVLGFLIDASILFTTLGNEDLFRNDVNYWLIVGCGCLVIPIILMPFGVLLSVFSCAIVGSYVVVFAADRFIGGSIAYIVLNVFKRAIYPDVYKASNQVPLQTKDLVLLIVWAVLGFLGISLQLFASLDKPPFPPPATCTTHPRSSRSNSRTRSPRSRRHSTSRRRSRTKRSVLRSLPVDDVTLRRSGLVRASAPPIEHADENQPLLYVVESVTSDRLLNPSYHTV